MFEWLFRHPWASYREGDFVWASGGPTWTWLLAIVVLALILVAAMHARRRSAAARRRGHVEWSARVWTIVLLQLAVGAGVLALLWRPALRVQRLEPGRNAVAVLIDVSRSMSFAEGEQSRLEQALGRFRADVLPELEARFAVEAYTFGADVQRLASWSDLPPPEETTQLRPALETLVRAARDTGLAAVIVLTDGRDKSTAQAPSFLEDLSQFGVPVHAIGAGRERLPEDLELVDVRAPARVRPGVRVATDVTVRHATQGPARIVVRRGDTVVAAREVSLSEGAGEEQFRVELDAREPGLLDLAFALDPLPNERILGNNQLKRLIEVGERPRRVLYLEGEPRWEYKFLRRAVQGDPSIELVSLLRTTRNKLYRQGVAVPEELQAGFPQTPEELFRYDALIVGSFEAASLTPEQHAAIREFVGTRGGSLLMLAGARGLGAGGWGVTALAEVLPAALGDEASFALAEQPVGVALTPHGNASEWLALDADPARNRELWRKLPPVSDVHPLGDLKLGAAALIETVGESSRPLLVMQRYGRGQAAILATSGTWRWHMQLERDDPRHRQFWRQLLRHLAGSAPEPVQLTLERAAERSEVTHISVDARTADHAPIENAMLRARFTSDFEPARELELAPTAEPGRFTSEAQLRPDTLYRVDIVLGGAERVALQTSHHRSAAAAAEDSAPQQDRAFLERIAEATGGRYWPLDALGGLPDALRASPRSITREELLELWSAPAFFIVLLVLRACEWLLRRRWGVI